jgi:hypothetical protein
MRLYAWTTYEPEKTRGYHVEIHGKSVFFMRPKKPGRVAYPYSGYDRFGGFA